MPFNYFKSNKGLSLVEVLGSIVLLAIVMISFMTVLPQMTSFNSKTESKLITINLAKEEMAEIQTLTFSGVLTKDSILSADARFREAPTSPPGTIGIKYEKKNQTYLLYFFTTPDLVNRGHIKNRTLHKVHLTVTSKENIASETYGYIEVTSK